jgi:hypothetical protein
MLGSAFACLFRPGRRGLDSQFVNLTYDRFDEARKEGAKKVGAKKVGAKKVGVMNLRDRSSATNLAAVLNRIEIQLVASQIANEEWEWTRPQPL